MHVGMTWAALATMLGGSWTDLTWHPRQDQETFRHTSETHASHAQIPFASDPTSFNMSGRLIASRLAPIARRAVFTPRRPFYSTTGAGGLLRSDAGLRLLKQRPWPIGSYALHNVPVVRSISFARVIPKIVTRFATAGAAAGGAVVAGISYVQYQAGRKYIHKRFVRRYLELMHHRGG